MKALSLKELELELGDILVCESDNSCMFTRGCEYEVMQAEDGKLGVNTDCGFLATTSASLFINTTHTHSDSKLSSGKLNEWPIHDIKREPIKLGEPIDFIGSGCHVGKSMVDVPIELLTLSSKELPVRTSLASTR